MTLHHTLGLFGAIMLSASAIMHIGRTDADINLDRDARPATQDERKTIIQDLCWSPGGEFIYFSAMKVKPDYSDYSPQLWTVYRFDMSTEKTQLIAKASLNVAVSPSGDQLAVAMNRGETRMIYILDRNGANSSVLVEGDAKFGGPSWSPDGKRIAFFSTLDGAEEIYTVAIDGNELKRVTNSKGYKAYNPAWSADGEHIVYYLEKGDGRDQIHVANNDGTNDHNVTNDSFNNIFPGWIDNETIIYGQGQKMEPTKAFRINIDGTGQKQVLEIESMYARYSPDGSRIAFINEGEGIIDVVTAAGKHLYSISVPS